jgi:hypothetical protein
MLATSSMDTREAFPRPAEAKVLRSRGRPDIEQVLDRWPCAGLAVAVIRNGRLTWFYGHDLADVAMKTRITEDR